MEQPEKDRETDRDRKPAKQKQKQITRETNGMEKVTKQNGCD